VVKEHVKHGERDDKRAARSMACGADSRRGRSGSYRFGDASASPYQERS